MREIEKRVRDLEDRSIELPMSIRDAMRFFAIVMSHCAGYGAPIEYDSMTPEERGFIETNMERYIQFCEMMGPKWSG